MDETKVAIIGCGPAGMVIAHACHQQGVPFMIYAPKVKSVISGAQYLHSDIGVRGVEVFPRTIKYQWNGTEAGYEKKIYGTLPEGLVTSWSKFQPEVEAWPLIWIYDLLWNQHHERIIDCMLNLDQVMHMAEMMLVFNTAPLKTFLPDADYLYETVMILDGCCFASDDTIVYNGEPDVPWYRSSNLWGHFSLEYPVANYYSAKMPHIQYQPRRIRKPLATDAVIPHPNVIASGRYGRWKKGVLVDESYHQAVAEIRERF